jgi:hypothetical protein
VASWFRRWLPGGDFLLLKLFNHMDAEDPMATQFSVVVLGVLLGSSFQCSFFSASNDFLIFL